MAASLDPTPYQVEAARLREVDVAEKEVRRDSGSRNSREGGNPSIPRLKRALNIFPKKKAA